MDTEFGIEFQLGDAAQIFLENDGFDLELVFVAGVLIVAAAAALKIRASRLDASWRGGENLVSSGTRKARFLFEQDSFEFFTLQDERYEGGLAPALFVRGQAGQTVAAVNEFFNGKLQELILQTLP